MEYAKEELNQLEFGELFKLINQKSRRIPPFCYIGKPLEESRKRYKEITDGCGVLLTYGESHLMDMRKSYVWCAVDANDK